MTETSKTLIHQVALILAAFPILAWDALAFSMIVTTCVQLFTGFDDFPVVSMLYSLPLAWSIVGGASLFAVIAIPIGRVITNIVEH